MSDAKNTGTVEVPRELVDRIITCLDHEGVARDLRACIKPRRWEFERHFGHEQFLNRGAAADDAISPNHFGGYVIPVRVTVEEIL